MLEPRWCIFTAENKPDGCLLILPGRGELGFDLAFGWTKRLPPNVMVATITPKQRRWYPQPYSPTNQKAAVDGLPEARQAIEDAISKIQSEYNLPKHRIALAGFSAGGVMAINVAAHSDEELAGVVCHAGAILEPKTLPKCQFDDMPIVLTHCEDDDVFDWEERYVPMLDALEHKGYNYTTFESKWGGHRITEHDLIDSAEIILPRLTGKG